MYYIARAVMIFLMLGNLAVAGDPPATGTLSVQELINRLSDDDYHSREDATARLVVAGEEALPALRAALDADDPETAWRAEAAIRMITWGVSPKLWSRIGDLLGEFERSDADERERIVRVIYSVAEQGALPIFRQILRRDPHQMVRQVTAIMLAAMGSEGLTVLVEEGVEIAGLDPHDAAVHILLGNSFLEDGNHTRAEHHYMQALKLDQGNYIAKYNMACVRSLQERIDEALDWLVKSVAAGYSDFEWMEKDRDLDNIRDSERYKEILRRGPAPRQKENVAPPIIIE